jgi:hypothetical protein
MLIVFILLEERPHILHLELLCLLDLTLLSMPCTKRAMPPRTRCPTDVGNNSSSRSTVPFRPDVHVTHHTRKKLFCFIRLKSKQNLSAISGEFFSKIVNIRSKWYSMLTRSHICMRRPIGCYIPSMSMVIWSRVSLVVNFRLGWARRLK